MPRTSKLSDMQLILLSTASTRNDGSLFPIPKSLKADDPRLDKAVNGLLAQGLAAEVDTRKQNQIWREEDDRRIGVVTTAAGREAIAVDPPTGEGAGSDAEDSKAASAPPARNQVKAGTKQAQLVEMLEREGGATIDEITAATCWLPHSARAMLTGLRKRGFTVTSDKVDGVRRYRASREAVA